MNPNNARNGVITQLTYLVSLGGASITINVDGKSMSYFFRDGAFCKANAGVNAVHINTEWPMNYRPKTGDQITFITEDDARFEARKKSLTDLFLREKFPAIETQLGDRLEVLAFTPRKSWEAARAKMANRPVFRIYEPGGSKDPLFEGTLEQLNLAGNKEFWKLKLIIKVRRSAKQWFVCTHDPREAWLLKQEPKLPFARRLKKPQMV